MPTYPSPKSGMDGGECRDQFRSRSITGRLAFTGGSMRVLIAECKQEVSTFNPALTGYDDFVIVFGDAVISAHREIRSEIGGALGVFAAAGVEAIGAYSARAITSGGTLSAAGWKRIAEEFLQAIRQA